MSLADALSGLLRLNDNMISKTSHNAFEQNVKTSYRLGENDSVTQDIYAVRTA